MSRTNEGAARLQQGPGDDSSGNLSGATLVDTELAGIKAQVEQARMILADAILKLQNSFTDMENETSQQQQVMRALVERLSAAEATRSGAPDKVSIQQFSRETTSVLGRFTDLLSEVSAQSQKAVGRIDDMANELHETFKLVGSVNDIADDTYLLAVNASIEAAHAGQSGRSFAVIAGNVRELSKKTRKFNDLIGAQVGKAQASVEDVRRIIGEMASRDLNVAMTGRERVQSMLGHMEEFERFVASSVATADAAAGRIAESTSRAVTALQFEDLMSQLIASIGRRVDRIHAAAEGAVDVDCASGVPQRPSQLTTAIPFRPSESEPVNQHSMAPGEVELF